MTTEAGIAILLGLLQPIGITGTVPAGVGPLESNGRVLWLPVDEVGGQSNECRLTSATRWSCPSVPAGESGVAIILGDNTIGYVVFGPTGAALSGSAEWGRLVRVTSGGLNADAVGDLRVSSWTIDRPVSRPNTQTLDVLPDTAVQVVKVSARSFWISGPMPSPDALLRLDGSGIARHDVAMQAVARGPVDSPFVIDATSGLSVTGRVETRSGEPVDGALIEIFARAPTDADGPVDDQKTASLPVIRLAGTLTGAEGRFEFAGLENGPYQVTATAFARGRRSRWTTTASPPLVMTLEPPATVTGRVIRRRLPAPDVNVRFVPSSTAWRSSTDPSAHLTADVRTDESGRFTLALPPQPSGDVQFVAPDGATTRIKLPALDLSEIALGDVALPDMIAIAIRADMADCRMTAIGPAGALGFSLVQGRPSSTIYQFDLPEPGEWFLDAECAGQHVSLQPPTIQIQSATSSAAFAVHVVTDAARQSR